MSEPQTKRVIPNDFGFLAAGHARTGERGGMVEHTSVRDKA
jgi:hypothetical protein